MSKVGAEAILSPNNHRYGIPTMARFTDTLIQDHRDCDHAFSQAESLLNAGLRDEAIEAFDLFVSRTELHFAREEEVLFPEFERATGQAAGPTMVMRSEHVRIRELYREMAACLRNGDDAGFLGLGETLFIMLQQHNGKEEQILYPMSDQVLAHRQADLLDKLTFAVG